MILTVASLILNISQVPADSLQHLDQLRWQNRLIVVHTAGAPDSALTVLKSADEDIVERHIVWFVISADGLSTNYSRPVHADLGQSIAEQLFDGGESGVVLIGKDGGVKKRADELDLLTLFGLIDTMPMRRAEMER